MYRSVECRRDLCGTYRSSREGQPRRAGEWNSRIKRAESWKPETKCLRITGQSIRSSTAENSDRKRTEHVKWSH